MEQSLSGKGHGDAVFIRGLDDVVVADRAAGFRDVGDAALSRALNIVAEREERVGAAGPKITSYFSNALSNAFLISAFVRSAFK